MFPGESVGVLTPWSNVSVVVVTCPACDNYFCVELAQLFWLVTGSLVSNAKVSALA